MTRILLTGGSGFIAAHILDYLLERGHSVVTTVRSQEKADKIALAHAKVGKDKLDFIIVEDIAQEGAFEQAVVSNPPFEAVIHTASPFHFNTTNIQRDLLDPAIIGTTGILKSIKKNAPSVKKVVITSSFAAIVNGKKGFWPEHTYSEADWNPITKEEATQNAFNGYRASKTFAEKAAWEFVEKEKPNFSITTMCPPLVFGPIVHYLNNLEALNTSNQRICDIVQGKNQGNLPSALWVDVRDIALGHVLAMEKDEAANKRFFFACGPFLTTTLVEIIRKNFPEFKNKLPPINNNVGENEPTFNINVDQTNQILGIKWTPLEKSVVDTVQSLKDVDLLA